MKTYSLMNAKTRELNNKINNLVPKIKQSVKAYDLKSFKYVLATTKAILLLDVNASYIKKK